MVFEAATMLALVLTPAEPGVLDVQAWDWLEQDLERMVTTVRQQPSTWTPETFAAEYLSLTVAFLELDPQADLEFRSAVDTAITEIDDAVLAQLRQVVSTHPLPGR